MPNMDRRHDNRRPVHDPRTLTVLDGANASAVHDILTRDVELQRALVPMRESLAVGQSCRLQIHGPGQTTSHICEVVRSRAISNGRHEMAVQFRKAI